MMSEELLMRLQSRRSFLKGSAILAASALAVPAVLSAQSQDQQALPEKQGQERPDGQDRREGQERQDKQDKQEGRDGQDRSNDAQQQQAKEGDGSQTFIDPDGRPYRVCPQCGSNMYKQDRTWTCENCGYSYVE
jgi:hypothetical protein